MSTEPETNQQPAQPTPPAAPPPAPSPTLPIPRRSAGLALVLSFFPGLGHLYLGLYQRGLTIFLSFAAAIWLASHTGELGILIAFVWFFGVIDAYRQAQFMNAGMLPQSGLASPDVAPKRQGGSLGFGVFLTALGILLLYNQFYPIDFSFLYDWWPLILVGFGVYIIAKYALEQKRRKDEEARAREEEEWQTPV
jgi:hypothetical protein